MTIRPLVLVVTGAPGAGKSSTARELARGLSAALLDQDSMTNPLVDVVSDLVGVQDLDDDRLADLVREPRYESMLRVAADCVSVQVPVVLVAPYTLERRDPSAWHRLMKLVHGFGGDPHLVWLRIAPADLKARLSGRAAARDDGKLMDLDHYVRQLDLSQPAVPFIDVDASLAPAVQADGLLRHLEPFRERLTRPIDPSA